MNRLTREFYRQDAVTLAKELLGKWLCRRLEGGEVIRRRITETEAYFGEEDTACHAHRGRTGRTEVMYAEGGCAYVYLCYGMYNMLNVVSGPAEHAEAVLIRGVEGYGGPGKLTKALRITRELNREDLTASERLWLEDGGTAARFKAGPRIGIGYASPSDRKRKWRFVVNSMSASDSGEQMLLDGFTGNLTSSKWAKICKVSQDTASREIKPLLDRGILRQEGQGRSTHYVL